MQARCDITAQVQDTVEIAFEQGTIRVTTAFKCQGNVATAAGVFFHVDNANFSNTGTLSGNDTVRTLLNNDLVNIGVIAPGFSVSSLPVDGDLKLTVANALTPWKPRFICDRPLWGDEFSSS